MVLLLTACTYAPAKTDEADSAEVTYETYACGWEKRAPEALDGVGSAVGDTLADISVVDQCGESFRLWDMFGEYFILYVTAAW